MYVFNIETKESLRETNTFKLKTNENHRKTDVFKLKIKDPTEIDTTEINVPTHLPNKIPEKIRMGNPNPSKETQIIENTKK